MRLRENLDFCHVREAFFAALGAISLRGFEKPQAEN
jgi:hypothetical protein